MKIVMLEPLGISAKEAMELAKPFFQKGHEFVFCPSKIENEDKLAATAKGADVLIIANSPLSGRIIRAAENLKLISVAFTGVDHVDASACREKRVIVCNAQGYCTNAVAELTFGLILAVLRKLLPCDTAVRECGTKAGLVGNELYGKTIGIIGTGAIGICVARIARAFGCMVLAHSRTIKGEAQEAGVVYTDLDKLMAESDIISIHTPLTPETKNLVSREKIALMKPNAILINAARGAVVDSNALATALNEGRIAGAGIDVFEMEPPIPAGHPLLNAKNTVLAPHVAFATKESMFRRAQITFDNISAWLSGKPQNVKNKV